LKQARLYKVGNECAASPVDIHIALEQWGQRRFAAVDIQGQDDGAFFKVVSRRLKVRAVEDVQYTL
jgi:hypothetical protein